jgi:bifunctional DNA-binding transcriptional regulator/antitoxin component of YhaV-PrlF toxin-antitoxin module
MAPRVMDDRRRITFPESLGFSPDDMFAAEKTEDGVLIKRLAPPETEGFGKSRVVRKGRILVWDGLVPGIDAVEAVNPAGKMAAPDEP